MKEEFSFENASVYDFERLERRLKIQSCPQNVETFGMAFEDDMVYISYVASDGRIYDIYNIHKENAFDVASDVMMEFRRRVDPFEEKNIKLVISLASIHSEWSETLIQEAHHIGVKHVEIVSKVIAVINAYENENSDFILEEGDIGVVYDWGKENFTIALLKKEYGHIRIICQDRIENPAFYVYGKIRTRDSILDNLKIQMCRKMMIKDKNVEFMTIAGIGPSDKKAWENFYNSAEQVLDQLLLGKDVKIKISGLIGSLTETYTQEDFSVIMSYFYETTQNFVKDILEREQISINNISKVYLSGAYANITSVQKWLKDYFGKEVCKSNNTIYAAVVGAAYLAKEYE